MEDDKKKKKKTLKDAKLVEKVSSGSAHETIGEETKRRFDSDPEYLKGLTKGSAAYGAAMTSPGNEEWKASQRKYPTHYSTMPNYPTKDEGKKTLREASAKRTYKVKSSTTGQKNEAYLQSLMARLESATSEEEKTRIRAEIARARSQMA